MVKRELIQLGSDILRKECTPVTDLPAARKMVEDMIDTANHLKTTYDFSRGIGISAPQIGYLSKIAVIEYAKARYVLINPEITKTSKEKNLVWEGCLSFFKYRAYVPRFARITVKTKDIEGNEFTIKAKGDFAASMQHEIDHLHGILYIDHLPNGEKDLVVSDKP